MLELKFIPTRKALKELSEKMEVDVKMSKMFLSIRKPATKRTRELNLSGLPCLGVIMWAKPTDYCDIVTGCGGYVKN